MGCTSAGNSFGERGVSYNSSRKLAAPASIIRTAVRYRRGRIFAAAVSWLGTRRRVSSDSVSTMSSSLSSSRWSRPAFLLLAATLSLASSATGAGTDAEAGSLDPRSLPGGGLHADLSMACGGCAATAHQLKHLLDRPPRDRLREMVQEWDERAGETREVPYHRSAKYVEDVLASVCARDSLARYRRRITWLGDVTWAVDDLPWDESARASRPVDDDLRAVCRRAVKHYRAELLTLSPGETRRARVETWGAARCRRSTWRSRRPRGNSSRIRTRCFDWRPCS